MKVIISLFIILLASVVFAEDELPADTSGNEIIDDTTIVLEDTTVVSDSIIAVDSTLMDSTETDSLVLSEMGDSLSFEEKYLEHQKKKRNNIPLLSVFDSLLTYFTSDLQNSRNDMDMAFYHDAGDYFRFSPSFFVNEYQATPMRKTVQPFGLGNNRLDIIQDGTQLNPFEHIPEPDGFIDINDIPTALDDEIYILSGPVGQLFGGSGSIASLVTRPNKPESFDSESTLSADKGGLAYNYVRGNYSKNYSDGRKTNALIEYHNSDGLSSSRSSDQYQYYGDFAFPLNDNYGLNFWGHLNDRNGPIVIHPDSGGSAITRDKFDRAVKLSLTRDNDDRTTGLELGYKHIRHESKLLGESSGSFNFTGHGGFLSREWVSGSKVFSFNIDGNNIEYDEGYNTFKRSNASSSLKIGWLNETWRLAISFGSDWVEEFDFLPNGTIVLLRKGDHSAFMLSAGYSERAPTMHELHLPYQRSSLYSGSASNYAEQGNLDLKSEKQTTGSMTYNYKSNSVGFGFSVTGGMVKDGIDWKNEIISDSTGVYRKFEPINNDFSFASLSFQPRLKLNNFLTYVGGASYNYFDYDSSENKPYTPEYQISSGMELHMFWSQKLMHLFAYGEIVYVGPYNGYIQKDLGNELIANAKLSFSFGNYKMHFVFQNVLNTQFQSREYNIQPGRFFYYGFTWDFLN